MKVKWYGTGLSGIIKDRGMDYYRHNQVHVKTVEVTENEKIRFTAEVEGTELYRVTALVSELGDVSGLPCTCP